MLDGRSLHDSSKGVGPARAILQRRIDRECLAQQSRQPRRSETCLAGQPQVACLDRQCQTKPISNELTKLIRRLRQFPGGAGAPGGAPGDGDESDEDDEGGLVTGPVEQWLKRMIKGTPSTPKAHKTATGSIKKKGHPSTSGSKIPVPKKSKTGTPLTAQEETDLAQRLEALRERRKTLEEKLAASGSWGKGKGKGKGKGPLDLERLKPLSGWEDWAQGKKSRRRLEYDSA